MSEHFNQADNGPDHEQDRQVEPRIYVASLSDYNAGILHGAWLNAAQETSVLNAGIAEMLNRSPSGGAEEWAIHDFEGFGTYRLSEYESIDKVGRLARGIVRHGEAFSAWAGYLGTNDWDTLDQFEDFYLGRWDSVSDYAEAFIDELDLREELEKVAPNLGPYISIDYEALGRDLSLGGDVVALDTSDGHGLYLFHP
jgi:antirestriction protein